MHALSEDRRRLVQIGSGKHLKNVAQDLLVEDGLAAYRPRRIQRLAGETRHAVE
jgi:hypothetical protein